MSEVPRPHSISVVVPVYRGATTLPDLVDEILLLSSAFDTKDGHRGQVTEILLVHDNGPDESAAVMRDLAAQHEIVRLVWLSRNYGQHAATLAGLASSGGDWIVTMDEDGQHDPAYVPAMLDVAMRERASLVYAEPTNPAPHGFVRNTLSKGAKRLIDLLVAGSDAELFHSYRLILGEYARSVSAYAAAGVYLDVALGWVAGDVATCPVPLRTEGDRPSGYSIRSLASHFWRMVLTSGTRLLRLVSIFGALLAMAGLVLAASLVVARVAGDVEVQGWTSVMVALLVCTGALLLSLGIIAEYLGVAVNMALGKPLYVMVGDPADGPLGRDRDMGRS